MDVILRGSTQTENIGDQLMSMAAGSLFRDMGVDNVYRLKHKGKGLEYIPGLQQIGAIFDLGNVHYCDSWPKPLEDRLRGSIRFNRLVPGAPLVFLPCSWGPFREEHRNLLDELTQEATVFGRDRNSVRFVNELLDTDRATLCPDLALMCEPEDPAPGRRLISRLGLSPEQPILGVIPNVRCVEEGITPLSDPAHYHRLLQSTVTWASDNGFAVLGISHMVGTDRDAKLLDDLSIPVFQSNVPSEVRSVIANLSMALCSRYHGLVNCLVHGVPPISLGWHHKYSGIMDLFGLLEFDHPVERHESELIARLGTVTASREELVQKIGTRLLEARSEIRGCMSSMSAQIGMAADVLKEPVVETPGATIFRTYRPGLLQRLSHRVKRSFT